MKTKMRKSNPPKEASPSLGGKAGHVVSPNSTIIFNSVKEWKEFCRHGKLSQTILLAFGAKPYDTSGKINLAGDVHVSFGKAASLFPRDPVANEHPRWLLVECFQDKGVFRVRDAWLLRWTYPPYAQLLTRVIGGKLVVKGFLNDKREQLDLQQGGVLPRRINALVWMLSPPDKSPHMLSRKCAGYADVMLSEENSNVAPRSLITFQRILLGCVALLQKLRNPNVPLLMVAFYFALGLGHLAAKVARPSRLKDVGMAQASALATALAGRVEEADPVVWAVGALVEASDKLNVAWRRSRGKENQPKSSLT